MYMNDIPALVETQCEQYFYNDISNTNVLSSRVLSSDGASCTSL